MIALRTHRRPGLVLTIALASVIFGFASTALLHAAVGASAHQGPFPSGPANARLSCAAPGLPGSVVDVTATDMGAMMGPGMMGSGMMGPGMMGPSAGYSPGMGMMRLLVNPVAVPAGPVSLRVTNAGALNHEVVVLPLAAGQFPGQRVSGPDGRIDESGSLGVAARSCGAGDGDGIVAAATGWITLTLPAGRYELVCNIAEGHYVAGMYAELDVVSQPK